MRSKVYKYTHFRITEDGKEKLGSYVGVIAEKYGECVFEYFDKYQKAVGKILMKKSLF